MAGGRRDNLGGLIALAGIAAIFIALRFALFFDPALHLGWNSDAAIFGMIAKRIAAGREFPIFYWGQSYMGVMTSYVAAAFVPVMHAAAALRLASSLLVLGGIVFYWLGLRRTFDARVANIVALWLAIGPAYLMHFSIAPIGGEQMFFLSAVIFWWGDRNWFVLGLLAGFGWWIHQGTVFAVAAVIAEGAGRGARGAGVRLPASRFLRGLLVLLSIDVVLGAIVSLGFDVPALFLYRPVLEPLTAMLILIAFVNIDRFVHIPWSRAAQFAAGAVIAYSPVIIGSIRGVVPKTYGFSAPLMPLRGVVAHFVTLVRSDFWLFIGAAASVVIVPFFILAMTRRPRLEAPLLTITFCFTFYLFSQRAHPGTMRYIVSALPFVYAFAAQEIVRFVLRPVAIAAVTLALLIPRIQQIDDVVHGRGEVYAGLPGGFDLRPALRTIESRGYTICWADYWIGYKLQWMSDERVRFIPYHSLDRTRAESAKLKAMPGRKCFVDARGNVTEMDPRDDGETAIGRTARERLRRMTGAPIIP